MDKEMSFVCYAQENRIRVEKNFQNEIDFKAEV